MDEESKHTNVYYTLHTLPVRMTLLWPISEILSMETHLFSCPLKSGCDAPYLVPAGAMCVAGFAGRQRQVRSAGIRQGAGSGGQRGQRQGHSLMVIEVMSLSITNGGSISDRARCLSLPPSTSSSTAHLQHVSKDAGIRNRARCDRWVIPFSVYVYSFFIKVETRKISCCLVQCSDRSVNFRDGQ